MNLSFFLSLLFLFSFSQSLCSQTKMDSTNHIRYLALGDSYTIGEAVDASERFPVQLVASLRKRGINIAEPIIIARTGWTTNELNAAIDKENPQGTYDIVTLLIGVNNQYRGRSAEEYRGQFKSLLKQAIAFAGNKPSHVVVLSIPDWGATPFAEGRDRTQVANEIDAFNAVNFEESVRAGAQYVDITPISREAARDGSLLASDGLHPSGKMYAEWAQLTLPKILTLVNK